jgi:hypothetical protein
MPLYSYIEATERTPVTLLTIDTEDNRTAKALLIASTANQWIRCRTKDGRPLAFGVPSQRDPNRFYLVTTQAANAPTSAAAVFPASTSPPSRST